MDFGMERAVTIAGKKVKCGIVVWTVLIDLKEQERNMFWISPSKTYKDIHMKIQCAWKTKNTVKLNGFVKCVGGLIAPTMWHKIWHTETILDSMFCNLQKLCQPIFNSVLKIEVYLFVCNIVVLIKVLLDDHCIRQSRCWEQMRGMCCSIYCSLVIG